MSPARPARRLSSRPAGRLLVPTACAVVCGVVAGQRAEADSGPPPAQVAWTYAPAGASFGGILAGDGAVYVLDRSGKVHALDAATGRKRWSSAGKESFSFSFGMALAPPPRDSALLVGSDSGMIAFDRKTGAKLWHTPTPLGVAGPACTEKAAIAGSSDGKVYAFDLETGRILWKRDYLDDAPEDPPGFAGGSARFSGRPSRPRDAATDGDMVVLSIFDQCRTLALDAATGDRRWAFQTQGWIYGRPAIGPRTVVIGSQDKHVYAVDKRSGKLLWKIDTKARNEASAAATDRFVYFGSCDAHLYSIDQGRVAWKFAIDHEPGRGAPIYSRPLVRGDKVYLASLEGKVYALHRATGKLVWSLVPLAGSELNSDLVSDGTRLFVTTRKSRDRGQSAVVAIAER